MRINHIQNYNNNNFYQNKSQPSFKNIQVSKEYFGPIYRYGSSKEQSKLSDTRYDLSQISTNLKIKSNWDDTIVGDLPEYMLDILKDSKESFHVRELYKESIEPVINKYSKKDKAELQEIKKKYNQMIDSLGSQGENLSIEIYPAPPHYNTQRAHMVYVIPALGIEGTIEDSSGIDAHYKDPFDSLHWDRNIALPSHSMVDDIKIEIFNKLNNIFEEGLKKGEDKITIQSPTGERNEEVLNTLKHNSEWYDEINKNYEIKAEEKRVAEWKDRFWYSPRTESCEERWEREERDFINTRRRAFNEEMDDD